MAEFPIMPVNTALLLSDTYNMDSAEFGAYVRILLAMWQNGGRLLESDLQKISGLTQYKWRNSCKKICRPLTIIEGTVSQKRLEDTRLKVRAKRAKAAKAAAARWKGKVPRPSKGPSICSSDAKPHAIKTKKVSKSLTLSLVRARTKSQQAASDKASKGHPLRAKSLP